MKQSDYFLADGIYRETMEFYLKIFGNGLDYKNLIKVEISALDKDLVSNIMLSK